jgi:hypothetical protein
VTYPLLGEVSPTLINDTLSIHTYKAGTTTTVLVQEVGPLQINLTLLNPLEVRSHSSATFQRPHMHDFKPQDWVKQSIPFSYMSLTAISLDNVSHAMQVYSDVSGGIYNPILNPVVTPQLRYRVGLGGLIAANSVEHDV